MKMKPQTLKTTGFNLTLNYTVPKKKKKSLTPRGFYQIFFFFNENPPKNLLIELYF